MDIEGHWDTVGVKYLNIERRVRNARLIVEEKMCFYFFKHGEIISNNCMIMHLHQPLLRRMHLKGGKEEESALAAA